MNYLQRALIVVKHASAKFGGEAILHLHYYRVLRARNVHAWLFQASCVARNTSADTLVLPILMECGGAVVLEAMAMSLPVIATNWGGPVDYLNESCGILVEPSSRVDLAAGLTDAMHELSCYPAKRRRMGLAARKKVVQFFDWEVKVDQMVDIYRSVSTMAS